MFDGYGQTLHLKKIDVPGGALRCSILLCEVSTEGDANTKLSALPSQRGISNHAHDICAHRRRDHHEAPQYPPLASLSSPHLLLFTKVSPYTLAITTLAVNLQYYRDALVTTALAAAANARPEATTQRLMGAPMQIKVCPCTQLWVGVWCLMASAPMQIK
eukprot:1146678-Pelagomonas_calceolata.AAC.1